MPGLNAEVNWLGACVSVDLHLAGAASARLGAARELGARLRLLTSSGQETDVTLVVRSGELLGRSAVRSGRSRRPFPRRRQPHPATATAAIKETTTRSAARREHGATFAQPPAVRRSSYGAPMTRAVRMADGELILATGALLAGALVASLLAGRLRVPGLLLFLGARDADRLRRDGLDRASTTTRSRARSGSSAWR